jgi:hypothetical protein
MPGAPGTNDRARTVLLIKFDLRLQVAVEPRRNRVVAASHPSCQSSRSLTDELRRVELEVTLSQPGR